MFKYFISLLIAVSMAMTPVVSVLATTVSGNAAHTQDTDVVPCHEMGSGEVVKDKSISASGTSSCEDCCKGGACQHGLTCSSCVHTAQLSTISPLAFLAQYGIGDNYQSDHSDGYPSLILSPAFRPPIS